eukprot:6463263-Prymnesium_polylepis.1
MSAVRSAAGSASAAYQSMRSRWRSRMRHAGHRMPSVWSSDSSSYIWRISAAPDVTSARHRRASLPNDVAGGALAAIWECGVEVFAAAASSAGAAVGRPSAEPRSTHTSNLECVK